MGVKWNRTLGCPARNCSTAGVLCAERLSNTMWISRAHFALLTKPRRNSMNSAPEGCFRQ